MLHHTSSARTEQTLNKIYVVLMAAALTWCENIVLWMRGDAHIFPVDHRKSIRGKFKLFRVYSTSFPGSLFFPPPATGGGKKRDPGNEVGVYYSHVVELLHKHRWA